ncbi:MAG TPA: hypothetical protein VGG28_09090 [Kofleriaceae bacterium]|jgi:hypothetical protein
MKALAVVALVACSPPSPKPTKVVENEPTAPHYAHPVRVDHPLMSRYHAFAPSPPEDHSGGNYESHNTAKPLASYRDATSLGDTLVVLALSDQARAFGPFDGFRVIVANASRATIVFPATDSALAMVAEARDPSGAWKPIEQLPNSWCGNSYHRMALQPGTLWEVVAPHYDGDFATKLRLRIDSENGSTYSNEWYGRVALAQLAPPPKTDQPYDPDNVFPSE